MNDFIKVQEENLVNAIKLSGYDVADVKLLPSSMKELGDYQFNGVMSLAKTYHTNPREIAEKIVSNLNQDSIEKISIDGPGFINITFKNEALIKYFNNYVLKEYDKKNKKIVIDYGGPNVAKVLHVGHLRSANIGEALKRLTRFLGYDVIADIHLGDFGRPLGLVIRELKELHPDWPYFDENFDGNYPEESPVTNDDLEKLYPIASQKGKDDEEYLEEARIITTKIQHKEKGYYELWKKIVEVSVEDIKKIYDILNVSFDLWKGEKDADEFVPSVINYLKDNGYTRVSEGATVVDVSRDDDKLEIPPLLLIKSNGSISYETTDLATIWDRVHNINPDEIWYVVDNRQSLHFEQVFRTCYKSKMVRDDVKLDFLGFGTMNGNDGKPFKTRDGGVMTLKELINLVYEETKKKVSKDFSQEEQENIAKIVSIAALKYADLLPVRTTDYIFDVEKFCDLNGKTGVYLLYSVVRMNSLLKKAKESNIEFNSISKITSNYDREIMTKLLQVDSILKKSLEDKSLSFITDYLYQLAKTFNSFYDNNKILVENDTELRESWLYLTSVLSDTMTKLITILGIEIPDKM